VDVTSSQRLSIRKWDLPGDLDDAFQMYGDAQTMRFIPCGALSREQTQGLIERMIERDAQNGFGIWAVVHRADRRVIGASGITYIPGHGSDIEIAWVFNKAYHGKGYATESATTVMQHAFTQLGLRRIYALIERENAASIRVANRLRMDYDRIVRAYDRDLMRYTKTP
jgi:[ribosomal protein S5]-alanine N-acetyltransferase